MQQLTLSFKEKVLFYTEDFIVSPSNIKAFQYISSWPSWGNSNYANFLYLYGEKGCGKTHLANIFASKTNGKFISELELLNKPIEQLITRFDDAFILEDIEEKLYLEERIFHLFNLILAKQKYLLITGKRPPQELKLELADLGSRIKAVNAINIASPDEELFRSVLFKNFDDKQIIISSEVLDFIVTRVDRSFQNIVKLVDLIDDYAKTNKKNITIQLVSNILKNIS